MNTFASIRKRLNVTQAVLAEALDVTQGNVSFYEKGQTVPPHVAGKLIEYASSRGLSISYDHVYGLADLPSEPAQSPSAAGCTTHAQASNKQRRSTDKPNHTRER